MTASLSRADVDQFAETIVESLGLHFDESRVEELSCVLRERVDSTGCANFVEFLDRLTDPLTGAKERRTLAERLTVCETYFFRNEPQLRAVERIALPALLDRSDVPRHIRVLSAGCASGEEPYSIAMMVRENAELMRGSKTEIIGLDISGRAIEKATSGRYSAWSLRQTPDTLRARYFRERDGDFELDAAIREMVRFEERNLADELEDVLLPDSFELVFCRNVLMYFSPEVRQKVVARLARALVPNGYLFLGHAENLRGVSTEFELQQSDAAFFYRRASRERVSPDTLTVGDGPVIAQPPSTTADELVSWYDAIEDATRRIRTLGSMSHRAPAHGVDAPATMRESEDAVAAEAGDVREAMAAMRTERFDDALATLDRSGDSSRAAQLLRAVILTNRGETTEARRLLEALRSAHELDADIRYQLGACLEHEGDPGDAMKEYRTAAYLDRSFAMPHFRLGLLAKRDGVAGTARNQLRHALELLPEESPLRVELFGGGFRREVLSELCVAELRDLAKPETQEVNRDE